MRIGIIGSGNMGEAFARLFSDAGHDVVIANSRGPDSLEELASELGPRVRATTVADAAASSEVLFLSVPYKVAEAVLREAAPLDGKLLVDVTNYYPQRDGPEVDPGAESSSVIVSRWAPGARVVKAFNTMYYKRLREDARPEGPEQLAVFVAGDDQQAKDVVSGLIAEVGFAPVDSGGLDEGGRRQHPGSSIYNVALSAEEARAAL